MAKTALSRLFLRFLQACTLLFKVIQESMSMDKRLAAVVAGAALCISIGIAGVYLATRSTETPPAAADISNVGTDLTSPGVEESEGVIEIGRAHV